MARVQPASAPTGSRSKSSAPPASIQPTENRGRATIVRSASLRHVLQSATTASLAELDTVLMSAEEWDRSPESADSGWIVHRHGSFVAAFRLVF